MNRTDVVLLKLELIGQVSPRGDINLALKASSMCLITSMGNELGLTAEESIKEVEYGIRHKYGAAFCEISRRYQRDNVVYFTETVQLEIDHDAARERAVLRRAVFGNLLDGRLDR